jgi:hypothetical protein
MAFDPTLKEVVLVGFSQQGLMETWAWTNNSWQQLHPTKSPSNRAQAGVGSDVTTGQIILFGGFNEGTGYLNDTWIWDGSTWTPSSQTNAPIPRLGAPMAFDASSNQLVMHGGGGPTSFLHDTWAWDGKQWTQLIAHQAQFRAATQAAECGAHACLVEAGHQVWQWQGGTWTSAG